MITNCPKCNTEFENKNKYGIKKFCSRKCANSRTWSNEEKIQRSIAAKNSIKLKAHNDKWKTLSLENKEKRFSKFRKTWIEKILNKNFNDLSYYACRQRVIFEQHNKCNRCGINNWLGEKLSLEIDHKDGNKKNNTRQNLEGLCPNCHSLTNTWRGKKNKKQIAVSSNGKTCA